MTRPTRREEEQRIIHVPLGDIQLEASLAIPEAAPGIVAFAHGSGSSRHSPRNKFVAGMLDKAGMATLLIDLLTPEEGQIDDLTRRLRFDINLLTERLVGIVDWLAADARTGNLSIGLFGASTGAAGALRAAAQRPGMVQAVVSRGGRPDMAANALPLVEAPTLLIVGGRDNQVIQLNEQAFDQMESAVKEMRIVPGAGHLFEEPGALEMVVEHAREWFERYLLGMDG